MSSYALTQLWQIVHGGGPITRDQFKGDGSSVWKAGQLLKLADGALTVVLALSGSPAIVDTDDIAAASRLFIALSDQDSATSGYVAVQEITRETVLRAQICDAGSAGTAAAQAMIGDTYALYQLANGVTGVDRGNATKPVVQVTNQEGNFDPYSAPRNTTYGFLYVKFIASLIA
jgi:hypothetical protein